MLSLLWMTFMVFPCAESRIHVETWIDSSREYLLDPGPLRLYDLDGRQLKYNRKKQKFVSPNMPGSFRADSLFLLSRTKSDKNPGVHYEVSLLPDGIHDKMYPAVCGDKTVILRHRRLSETPYFTIHCGNPYTSVALNCMFILAPLKPFKLLNVWSQRCLNIINCPGRPSKAVMTPCKQATVFTMDKNANRYHVSGRRVGKDWKICTDETSPGCAPHDPPPLELIVDNVYQKYFQMRVSGRTHENEYNRLRQICVDVQSDEKNEFILNTTGTCKTKKMLQDFLESLEQRSDCFQSDIWTFLDHNKPMWDDWEGNIVSAGRKLRVRENERSESGLARLDRDPRDESIRYSMREKTIRNRDGSAMIFLERNRDFDVMQIPPISTSSCINAARWRITRFRDSNKYKIHLDTDELVCLRHIDFNDGTHIVDLGPCDSKHSHWAFDPPLQEFQLPLEVCDQTDLPALEDPEADVVKSAVLPKLPNLVEDEDSIPQHSRNLITIPSSSSSPNLDRETINGKPASDSTKSLGKPNQTNSFEPDFTQPGSHIAHNNSQSNISKPQEDIREFFKAGAVYGTPPDENPVAEDTDRPERPTDSVKATTTGENSPSSTSSPGDSSKWLSSSTSLDSKPTSSDTIRATSRSFHSLTSDEIPEKVSTNGSPVMKSEKAYPATDSIPIGEQKPGAPAANKSEGHRNESKDTTDGRGDGSIVSSAIPKEESDEETRQTTTMRHYEETHRTVAEVEYEEYYSA